MARIPADMRGPAVTVRRAGTLLVTRNLRDFELIRRFCNVRLQSGPTYFGHPLGE
jgi:hypothetical protein